MPSKNYKGKPFAKILCLVISLFYYKHSTWLHLTLQLPIKDTHLNELQHSNCVENHANCEACKAASTINRPEPEVNVGDLVCIHNKDAGT